MLTPPTNEEETDDGGGEGGVGEGGEGGVLVEDSGTDIVPVVVGSPNDLVSNSSSFAGGEVAVCVVIGTTAITSLLLFEIKQNNAPKQPIVIANKNKLARPKRINQKFSKPG